MGKEEKTPNRPPFRSLVIREETMCLIEELIDDVSYSKAYDNLCSALHWANRAGVPGNKRDPVDVAFKEAKECLPKVLAFLNAAGNNLDSKLKGKKRKGKKKLYPSFNQSYNTIKRRIQWAIEKPLDGG